MPINITDVDEFTDPATRPADGEPVSASSWLGPFQKLANRTRWLYNRLTGRLGGASGSGEWSYPSPRARQILLTADGLVTAPVRHDPSGTSNTPVAAADWWKPYVIETSGPPDTLSHTGWQRADLAGLFGHKDVSAHLRSDQVVTAVRAWVDQGVNEATQAERIELAFVKRPLTSAAAETVIGAVSYPGAGTGVTTVDVSGLSETIDRSQYAYAIRIRSSANAGTTRDLVGGFRISLNDPGPRS